MAVSLTAQPTEAHPVQVDDLAHARLPHRYPPWPGLKFAIEVLGVVRLDVRVDLLERSLPRGELCEGGGDHLAVGDLPRPLTSLVQRPEPFPLRAPRAGG